LYYQKHRAERLAYQNEYRKKNKEAIVLKKAKHQIEKKQVLNEISRQYYQNNKKDIRQKQKIYQVENKEAIGLRRFGYYRENKKIISMKNSIYRKENPEIRLRNDLMKMYGISLEDFRLMEASQGGVCKICGRPPSGKQKRLQIDHDHSTGKIRGLLCSNCNTALGLFKDNPHAIDAAAQYLRDSLNAAPPFPTVDAGGGVSVKLVQSQNIPAAPTSSESSSS